MRTDCSTIGSPEKTLCACLLCLALASTTLLPAQEVSLSGQVLDAAGVPMDGVLVRLLGADLSTLTGSDGKWCIEEGTPKAIFPTRVESPSRVLWNGPGSDLQTEFKTPTEVTVLMFAVDGTQVGKQQYEANGTSSQRLSLANATALVGIATQACDRVVYNVSEGRAVLTFSTCAGATPSTEKEVKDIISFERPGWKSVHLPLNTLTAAEVLQKPVRLAATTQTVAADPSNFSSVLRKLNGGETVLLSDGNYGVFEQRGPSGLHDWVLIKPAPDAKPVFEKIDFPGTTNNPDGEHDQWLCFEGLRIEDGVALRGARWVEFRNCFVQRRGEITGSMRDVEKAAVAYRQCRSIRIEGCEVTHSGNGISGTGNHIIYRRNHVHHCGQDGLHYLGGHDFLCEYNDVHDFDDGADDSEKKTKPWNMHADCLQMYPIWAADRPSNWLADCTMRGNRFYRPECLGWMIQAKRPDELKRFFFENNITAAVPGYMFHFKDSCDGVVFRFNTFLIPDPPFEYTGTSGRHFVTKGLEFVAVPSWCSNTTFVEVYGNVMGGRNEIDGKHLTRCDNNIYYGPGPGHKGPGERRVGTPPFVDVTSIEAVPTAELVVGHLTLPDQPTDRQNVPLPAYDANGNPRTSNVCLGAVDLNAKPPKKIEVAEEGSGRVAKKVLIPIGMSNVAQSVREDANAKSDAAPVMKAVGDDVKKAWTEKLKARVKELLATQKPIRIELAALKAKVAIRAMNANDEMQITLTTGGTMNVAWQQLEPADLTSLALTLAVKEELPVDHALAGFFLLAAGDRTRGLDHLGKAGAEGRTVEELFEAR